MRHAESLQVVSLPLSELVPDPDNPRLHSERNLAAIRVSLETHGQVAPLVVQRDGLTIIGGNATAASLKALGRTEADVVLIDCDDVERKQLAIRLNRTAELADWDSVVLGEFLANADDGGAFGFDQGEVDAFVRDLEGPTDDWPDARPTLEERFGIPPFSVIDARRGRWPARKRAWIALGIESEIGREGSAIYKSVSGQVPNYYYQKSEAEAEVGRTLSHSEFREKHLVMSESSGISAGGTSVFDPVLTEILIRWYSGKGGTILDPFAGGSVRGVVAATLGRKYTGVELRSEQVEANRVQWEAITERLAEPSTEAVPIEPVRLELEGDTVLTPVEAFNGWCAKREDLACFQGPDYPSGLKMRQYLRMAKAQPGMPMLVGCSANSAMQIYVAAAANMTGVPGIVYVPARKKRTAATEWAIAMGAEVIEVRPGYKSVYRQHARERAKELGGAVRWDVMGGVNDVVDQMANIPEDIRRIVVPTGSGLVCAGVLAGLAKRGWTDIGVLAVAVSEMADEEGIKKLAARVAGDSPLPTLTLVRHPTKYDTPMVERLPDGTPLDPFYAAKAVEYVRDGDLLWVPGLRPVDSMPVNCREAFAQRTITGLVAASDETIEANPSPTWIEGDSSEVVSTLIAPNGGEGFDMVLSCPPYFDLEVYSEDERDLSAMKWDAFLALYRSIIDDTVAKLADNRFICWVVSDVRDKDGNYRGLVRHTIDAFEATGAKLYNEVTLVTSTGSAAVRAPRPFEQSRKLARIHQIVLVFVKGDPKKATEVCGPVEAVGFDDLQPDEPDAHA